MERERIRRVVVKVGSNVLSKADGTLDTPTLESIVGQIASLHRAGMEIILVSSGAVASGRALLPPQRRLDAVSSRQLYSAVGQARLVNRYFELFGRHGILCGQVLTTKESLSTRSHYLNQMHCMGLMLEHGVIPVVNENDTISVTELMFTDNDELSALVASMMGAQCLVMLSNVDGLLAGGPGSPVPGVIREIRPGQDASGFIVPGTSSFGRGGMLTKYRIAAKAAREGISVVIANGKRKDILPAILASPPRSGAERPPCTEFLPSGKPMSRIKKWIAHSADLAKGSLHVNQGAYEALTGARATSLLPVGVTRVQGEFERGDIVRIIAPDGHPLGLGKVAASSARAVEHAGQKGKRPLVHYDHLYIDPSEEPRHGPADPL